MWNILSLIIFFITIWGLFFFTKNFQNTILNIKEENNEETAYTYVSFYSKIIYIIFFLLFVFEILIYKHTHILSTIYCFCWFFIILFLKLHMKLMFKFLDVLFIRNSLSKINCECGVGYIKKIKKKVIFKYRIRNMSFYI